MKLNYRGSCHCGAVQFEADVDLMAGSRRCNCTYCMKTRYWKSFIGVEDIRLLRGEAALSDYRAPESQWPEGHIHHYFCRHCGVQVYSKGFLEEMGGWFMALNIAVLDDVEPETLAAVPIIYEDGIADRQLEAPKVTAYL